MASREDMTPEELRRARRRAARRKAKRRRQRILRAIYLGIFALVCLIIIGVILLVVNSSKVKDATVEAGQELNLADFIKKEKNLDKASFVTDISTIDTSAPGTYPVSITVGKKTYDAEVTIEDTTAPTADAVSDYTTNKDVVPDASELVANVTDVTDVSITYQTEPDVSAEGTAEAVVLLTDTSGNTSEVTVPITVVVDTEAPVISGTKDLSCYTGDTIAYKSGVTVTDNIDPDPELTIDKGDADTDKAGEYEITYIATDMAGNTSKETVTLTVEDKPDTYVEPEVVLELAQKVYDQICTDSMTPMAKAFAIYNWVNTHITYTGTSDKTSWTRGAYDAFTNLSGDCYNYFAAAKALYQIAGIDNIDVVKSVTTHSRHYWSLINIGTGWYHVDCTPRTGSGDNFFMVTDEELLAYSEAHKDSHIFDGSLYPERATVSVQDKINYSTRTLTE